MLLAQLPEILGAGQGEPGIPYDQTAPAQPPPPGPPMGAPPPEELGPLAGLPPSSVQPGGSLAQLGDSLGAPPPAGGEMGMEAPPSTDQLSDVDLAAQDPATILNDPNLSPEDRAMLEQELMLAAKRSMIGA